MNQEQLYQIFLRSGKVSTDTRRIEKDSIFFALKGDRFNGNLFAGEALSKGASYAMVDEPAGKTDDRCILVDDVLKTLQNLATMHRRTMNIPVLGITGTNGKTTTKELIAAVVSAKMNVLYTKGNLNNQIGVPLTLLELNKSHQFAIIEMGASHPGDIDELCNIAEPTLALITNIGQAHLEGFGSPEGVIKTKTELYRYIQKHGGTIFYNRENEILSSEVSKLKDVQLKTYGTSGDADCKGSFIAADPFVSLKIAGEQELVKTMLAGKYNFENILAAACIGKYLGYDTTTIRNALASYQPVNNRSQIKETASNTILVDCYNANPTSMKVSVDSFLHMDTLRHKKALILGDMLELGTYSDTEHKKIMDIVNHQKNVLAFFVGEIFSKHQLYTPSRCFKNAEELIAHLKENPLRDAMILLKGSRGIKLETVLENL